MKKFRFKLATLLKVREEEEKEAQRALMAVQKELDEIQNAIQQLVEERRGVGGKHPGKSSYYADEMTLYFGYLEQLAQKIAALQDEAMRVENVVEQKKALLREAVKERKVLEKLKERQLEEWKEELRKVEGRFLDEMAVLRHDQKSRAGS